MPSRIPVRGGWRSWRGPALTGAAGLPETLGEKAVGEWVEGIALRGAIHDHDGLVRFPGIVQRLGEVARRRRPPRRHRDRLAQRIEPPFRVAHRVANLGSVEPQFRQ